LLLRGDQIIVIKRKTSNIARIKRFLEYPTLQLFDNTSEDLFRLFNQYPVDTIIHTATEYGRGDTPIYKILDANLLLPLQLAEMGMQSGLKCFINTDSFFNKSGNSYSNLLNYSVSKKSLVNWLEKLSTNLKIVNVILEHMYGPGDNPAKFVEHVIRKVGIEQVPYIALTYGHQRRDFIFLDDIVDAFLILVDYGRTEDFRFESFQVGSGFSTQVRDFVDQVKLISGSKTTLGFGDIPYRVDEIMSSQADITRLRRLGWKPVVTSSDGISRILNKYQMKIAGLW
jgi:nucleoside-diphosphate-sugar epimerase